MLCRRVADMLCRRVGDMLRPCLLVVVLGLLGILLHHVLLHSRLRHVGHFPRRRRRADSEESKSTICSSSKYAFHTFSKTVRILVCFLTQDSHNEIKVSCCPRIRAPEMQQIHEQKRVRSLQPIEAVFIQTKCTHSRKIADCNFSIWIPHITRADSTRYATWILTCSHRCHGDALRMSYAMNNHDVIAFLHFVHG